MFLTVKDKQLLENYNKIWRKKIEELMKIDFNTDKYIKAKIETYKDIIITSFYNKKIPEGRV